jgi:hypothetical protein
MLRLTETYKGWLDERSHGDELTRRMLSRLSVVEDVIFDSDGKQRLTLRELAEAAKKYKEDKP